MNAFVYLPAALLAAGAFLSAGYLAHSSGRRGDTPQQRDAVALVTANIASAISFYDLEWNNPPHVLSVETVSQSRVVAGAARLRGDTVVTEEVRMSTTAYDGGPVMHMRFVVRGIVSAKNWLRSMKVIVHQQIASPEAR